MHSNVIEDLSAKHPSRVQKAQQQQLQFYVAPAKKGTAASMHSSPFNLAACNLLREEKARQKEKDKRPYAAAH